MYQHLNYDGFASCHQVRYLHHTLDTLIKMICQKMGNETSQLAGLEIDEKAVEVTDFWTHHSAVLNNETVTPLSVFIGEPLIGGSLWINQTPLEKATKNLMLHRHPCILKYISSWHRSSKLYLAVEYVKPLAHVLASQTTLQICMGLHNVLKAITFLHEKATASHNNICSACIYVTQDGSWKLGGLEYLCRFQDLTGDYLTKTRTHRYEKAIDPDEEKLSKGSDYLKSGAIDKYAFAVLVDEVLRKRGNNEVPFLEEFRQFCKTELQNQSPAARTNWQNVLKHEFFTHNFIVIYSFLTELPLKSETEKEEFFGDVALKLRLFPEEIVAKQLGELLLSRLVLLDKTAQTSLLPFVLTPKQEATDEGPIFSEAVFKQNIIPKILHIFRVRDAQIRLLLLSHFKGFVGYFTKEQLQSHILPELLIGIKDTNDNLVSVTLIALSELVPILGAAAVIGGKRARLFNDGRPAPHTTKKSVRRNSRRPSLNEQVPSSNPEEMNRESPPLYLHQMLQLPERPSPDGGEEEISTTEVDQSAEDDLENWSDWDYEPTQTFQTLAEESETEPNNLPVPDLEFPETLNTDLNLTVQTTESKNSFSSSQISVTKLPDITELDIKNQKNNIKDKSEEFDFFQDMEPVIEINTALVLPDEENNHEKIQTNNLNLNLVEHSDMEDGWGNEDLDWA